MIAKIGKGANILGAIAYNQNKVDRENGSVLLVHKIPETQNGQYTATGIYRYFEPYLIANNRTEKPVRHISLNPDPGDRVDDAQFREMASQYMLEMGYGSQPYVVYKHTDIERTHIHIVTTCIAINGRKISDAYDHHHSMAACRKLEKQFSLKPATAESNHRSAVNFSPVDYTLGDTKSQLAAVIRYLPKYYCFQGLGSYNALLSLFNVTCEQITGESFGKSKRGLVYFALDTKGEKTGKPFKSSLFGKQAGLDSLESHFEKSKKELTAHPSKMVLKNTIEAAMHMAREENAFRKQLSEQGVNLVVRRNIEGRIYGITFIDHESRSVWNGSQLSKNLSANALSEWWDKADSIGTGETGPKKSETTAPTEPRDVELPEAEMPPSGSVIGIIDALAGLLPDNQGEDYQELAFENRMKRRKRKK